MLRVADSGLAVRHEEVTIPRRFVTWLLLMRSSGNRAGDFMRRKQPKRRSLRVQSLPCLPPGEV